MVKSDILLNYPRNSLTSTARLFVGLLVAFSYPLQQHPARRSIMSIVSWYLGEPDASEAAAIEAEAVAADEAATKKHGKEHTGDTPEEAAAARASEALKAEGTVKLCGKDTGVAPSQFRVWIVTVVFLILSYILALSVKSLGKVLAFVGATGSTMVSYILPGFCYYFIFDEKSKAPKWKRTAALIQGCLGLIIVPVCLTFIFI